MIHVQDPINYRLFNVYALSVAQRLRKSMNSIERILWYGTEQVDIPYITYKGFKRGTVGKKGLRILIY